MGADGVEFLPAAGAPPIRIGADEVEELGLSLPEQDGQGGWIRVSGGGRTIRLDASWELRTVAADLARALLPGMVERAEAALERGEVLEFRPRLRAKVGLWVTGFLTAAVFLAALSQFFLRWSEGGKMRWGALLAVGAMAGGAVRLLGGVWARGRGGLRLSKSGLSPLSGEPERPWSAVAGLDVDATRYTVRFADPPATLFYGVESPNAVVLRGLVEGRRPGV